MKLDWWCKKFRERRHELCMYKIVCTLSLCDECFSLNISKCIQISCSTAVSLYYTAAPALPASLPLPCIFSGTQPNLWSLSRKHLFPLFLMTNFSPLIVYFYLSTSIKSPHWWKILHFNLQDIFCPWLILFQSYISYVWSSLPPLYHTWSVIQAHTLNHV